MKHVENRSSEVGNQVVQPPSSAALRLAEIAYQTVENPDIWPSFYRELHALLGGRAATVVIRGFGPTAYVNLAVPDRGFSDVNPSQVFVSKGLSSSCFGLAYLSSSREARCGQVVRDPRELTFVLRELESGGSTNPVAIEVFLSNSEECLDSLDTELLGSLFPHWHRALAIGYRLKSLDEYRGSLDDALDTLRIGIMVLGPRGQVKTANRHARQYLKGRTALCTRGGELALSDPRETKALTRKIKSSALGTDPNPTPTVIEVENSDPALLWLQSFRPGLALAIVTDGAGRRPIAPDVLQETFALTRTEAKVASLFSGGATPSKIAENLQVSPHTVAQKLAKIRDRTQVRSGVELMRLLMASVPATAATEEGGFASS